MFMGTITELGIHLADLVESHADWSRETFGDDAKRGPVGPLKHLEKEATEAREAAETMQAYPGLVESKENFKEEMADCLLLLLDASRRGGVKVMQLIEAAQKKLKKNKLRTWPKNIDENSPVKHQR